MQSQVNVLPFWLVTKFGRLCVSEATNQESVERGAATMASFSPSRRDALAQIAAGTDCTLDRTQKGRATFANRW